MFCWPFGLDSHVALVISGTMLYCGAIFMLHGERMDSARTLNRVLLLPRHFVHRATSKFQPNFMWFWCSCCGVVFFLCCFCLFGAVTTSQGSGSEPKLGGNWNFLYFGMTSTVELLCSPNFREYINPDFSIYFSQIQDFYAALSASEDLCTYFEFTKTLWKGEKERAQGNKGLGWL